MMKCKKNVLALFVSFWSLMLLCFLFPLNLQAANGRITFEPKNIKSTVFLGRQVTVPISFTSSQDLGECKLWVVPELQPYMTFSQSDFIIRKGQKYQLNLVVDVKGDAPTGMYDGTIHLKSKNKTIPNTLKVELDVIGPEELINKLAFYSENDDSNDLDGDGLLNNFEIHEMNLRTLPDSKDSDGDGVKDGQEDNDQDGLTNIQEQQYGTNPLRSDSDNDGLSDIDEISIYFTNPLLKDTDSDNLQDNDELALGTDPNNQDSNGNGILDGDEIYETTATSEDSTVEIVITGQGNIAKQVHITNIESHGVFDLDVGKVLPPILPIDIVSEKSFDKAIIKFFLSPEIIANYNLNNLKIAHFDETLNTFVPLANQGINLVENYIWAETTHFSIFAVIDELILNTLFDEPFNGSSRGKGEFIDIVFCLDSSGSMSWNDPSGIRKSASKTLIDALSADDRVAVVDFDSGVRTWQTLTKDKIAAKNGINRVNSSGGTNIGAGVNRSIQEILARGIYENKLIILLTDGQGSYSSTYTQQAADNGIIIHVIGLGNGVNRTLLAGIASGTGGNYYQVSYASQLLGVFDDIREETQDTDGDGLTDYAETNGMRTGLGLSMFTDPYVADTDGDGLTDGEEMGAILTNVYWGENYYLMSSNPNKKDSDGDGVNDKEEIMGLHSYPSNSTSSDFSIDYSPKTGTKPLNNDSDGDGISDYYDRYPNQWDWYGKYRKGDIIVGGHTLDNLISVECGGDYFSTCAITSSLAMYKWSHAVVYMGNEKTLDSHPRHPNILLPSGYYSNGSVDWGNIHEFLYNKHYDWIAILRVRNKSVPSAINAGNNAETYLQSAFEYPGWGELENTFKSEQSLYCAELVYKAWKPEGVDLRLLGMPFPWVRPNDIYTNPKTKILKEIGNEFNTMSHERP